jgi:peptidoglycan/LPS O-acetylase OafA/YrhL
MNKPRAYEIDLLRFLAAIAVVLFHYAFRGYVAHSSSMPYPWLEPVAKYGSYGVDLFFMISGFVILMSASSGSIKHFVISRIVRLYPAFWICCTLTFLVLITFGKGQPTLPQYFSNMTMLSNFKLMQMLVPKPHIDGAYWSLMVEIRFYILVAVVLMLRQIHRAELFLTAWLVTVILFELTGMDRLDDILIVEYAAYFIGGAMAYQIWAHGVSSLRLGVIGVSWIVALYENWLSLPKFEAATHTSMDRGIIFSLVTVFFLLMLLIATKKTGWIGRVNWMKFGALTYPLYLVHQAIGYVIFNNLYPGWNPHVLLWGTVAFMLVIAYVITTYFERPIGDALKKQLNRSWDDSRTFFKSVASRSSG